MNWRLKSEKNSYSFWYSFTNFAYESYLTSNGKTRSTTAGSQDISMEVKLTEIQIYWAWTCVEDGYQQGGEAADRLAEMEWL